jgi:hypothetical protein
MSRRWHVKQCNMNIEQVADSTVLTAQNLFKYLGEQKVANGQCSLSIELERCIIF